MPMLKQALKNVLSESELSLLSSSFDVIGSIAVLKVPIGLVSKERLIGEEILSHVKNVRSVFSQASDVGGEFRIRDLKLIAGEENYDTIYKESGCVFKVNVRDVYFSPRLSTERERIAKLAKDGERIFNMFAGVGTFSIVIAKTKSCPIDSVDKNPKAIELAKESLLMNKKLAGKVYPILADAKEYAGTHEISFDRVLMPLPERADEFLPFAVKSCKEGGTIHYYVHVPEHEFRRKDWIETHLQELDLGSKLEVTNWRRVREVGPHYIQAVADLLVCRKT